MRKGLQHRAELILYDPLIALHVVMEQGDTGWQLGCRTNMNKKLM